MTDAPHDIEHQIRFWAEHLADSIPAYESIPTVQTVRGGTRPGRLRSMAFGSVAAAVVIIGGTAIWRTLEIRSDDLAVGSQATAGSAAGSSIVADYEKIEYVQEAGLTCPRGSMSRTGAFNQMTIETWATLGAAQVRTSVRYPDGSSRDVVIASDGERPPKVFVRGTVRGDTLGCAVDGNEILVSEPAQSGVYSLNLPASSKRSPSEVERSPGFADLGTQVAGEHADSRGRTVQLWRQRITGFVDFDGARKPITQTTEWYLDGAAGKVLEQTYVNEIESLGTARWTATLVESSRSSVPASTFGADGYERVQAQSTASSPTTSSKTSPPVPRDGTSATSPRARP